MGDTLKMLFQLIALTVFSSTFVSCSKVRTQERRDLLCDVCMDIVTDIDEWITSDSTMDEIVQFVEGICSSLGWIGEDIEAICRQLIEENLPNIIDGLVEGDLSPTEVCTSIGWCYTPPPTSTAAPQKKLIISSK